MANPRSQRRPGDWDCPRCSYANFAFRRACNSCGAHAPGGGAGQGVQRHGEASTASRLAPGGRPPRTAMEAREVARRAGEPAFRVPRSASATSARPGGASAPSTGQQRGCDVANSSGAAAAAVGRAAQREAATDAAASAMATPTPAASAWATSTAAGGGGSAPRGRWSDEDPPCDAVERGDDDASDYADADAADADLEEEDEGEGDAWTAQPTSEDLRARWQQECRAVRALERAEKFDAGPSSALSAARGARDRAELEWRQSLEIKPVAMRMANTQRKVDRARRAVDRAADDLEAFEEEMRHKRQELQDVLDSARRRHDIRLRELDDLHKEAGELAAANAGSGQRREQRTSGRAERLVDLLTSEMQAFVEMLEEGSEARGRANLILAKVASADEDADAQRYVIHTDGEEVHDDEGFQTVARRGRSTGGKGGANATRRETNWTATASGRWCRHRASGDGDDGDCMHVDANANDADRPRGTASNKRPGTDDYGASEGGGVRETPARGRGGDPGDGAARTGKGGRTTDAGGDEVHQPPNKSHRGHDQDELPHVESAGDDAARALRLKHEQDALVQATVAARASFGDNTAMQIAGQLYAQKVEALRERAKAAGVDTAVEGREILQLTPEELNMWIDGTLKPAECKGDVASTEL